jgi:hypothetical protein
MSFILLPLTTVSVPLDGPTEENFVRLLRNCYALAGFDRSVYGNVTVKEHAFFCTQQMFNDVTIGIPKDLRYQEIKGEAEWSCTGTFSVLGIKMASCMYKFTHEEMKFILLHELNHIKNRDLKGIHFVLRSLRESAPLVVPVITSLSMLKIVPKKYTIPLMAMFIIFNHVYCRHLQYRELEADKGAILNSQLKTAANSFFNKMIGTPFTVTRPGWFFSRYYLFINGRSHPSEEKRIENIKNING